MRCNTISEVPYSEVSLNGKNKKQIFANGEVWKRNDHVGRNPRILFFFKEIVVKGFHLHLPTLKMNYSKTKWGKQSHLQ